MQLRFRHQQTATGKGAEQKAKSYSAMNLQTFLPTGAFQPDGSVSTNVSPQSSTTRKSVSMPAIQFDTKQAHDAADDDVAVAPEAG